MIFSRKADTILMLDDEVDIMSIFTQALELRGFPVIGFTESILALDHFQKNSDLYWLVVSDIRMPVINGYQFIKKVREINHDVKVFFMSAYLDDDVEFRTDLNQFISLVKKYFQD